MTKRTIAAMLLIMGTVALGVAQESVSPATLNVVNELTTSTSITLTLTAGTNPINGFTVQYSNRGGIQRQVFFPDALPPFGVLQFTLDNLDCDTGYRIRSRSTTGDSSTTVTVVTDLCE